MPFSLFLRTIPIVHQFLDSLTQSLPASPPRPPLHGLIEPLRFPPPASFTITEYRTRILDSIAMAFNTLLSRLATTSSRSLRRRLSKPSSKRKLRSLSGGVHPYNMSKSSVDLSSEFTWSTEASHQPRVEDDLPPEHLCRSVILDFFDRTGVLDYMGSRTPHPSLHQQFFSVLSTWNLDFSPSAQDHYSELSLNLAITAYRATSLNLQLHIALFTYLSSLFHDGFVPLTAMREFHSRFYAGQSQLHPILNRWIEVTMAMQSYFPPHTANTLVSSLLATVNAAVFAREGGDHLVSTSRSPSYLDYKKSREGVPEAYSVMIWPKDLCPHTVSYIEAMPDAMLFITSLNAVFSYYKSAQSHSHSSSPSHPHHHHSQHPPTYTQTHNFLQHYARACGESVPSALRQLADQAINAMYAVSHTLEGTEREAWEHFVAGYTQFHLISSRYRLSEILPEWC